MKIYWIYTTELQDYLDKFGSAIKFMMFCTQYYPGQYPGKFMLVIDENVSKTKDDVVVDKLSFDKSKKDKKNG